MSVGERIRQIRNAKKLSLAQVERKTGIDRSSLWKIEKDPDANPTLKTLQRIADAGLDVDIAELFIGPGGTSVLLPSELRDSEQPPAKKGAS